MGIEKDRAPPEALQGIEGCEGKGKIEERTIVKYMLDRLKKKHAI